MAGEKGTRGGMRQQNERHERNGSGGNGGVDCMEMSSGSRLTSVDDAVGCVRQRSCVRRCERVMTSVFNVYK